MNVDGKKLTGTNLNDENPKQDSLDIKLESRRVNTPTGRSNISIDIFRDVFEGIRAYAGTDTSKELGGIILGSHTGDNERSDVQNVLVKGYVSAKYTEALRGSVTFTHKSWDEMHKEREDRYPGLTIVGWFHTHPGFGIFLSSYDLFIHQNFFDLPWQIAYVVDPVNNKEGFFCWSNGKIEPCDFRVLENPAGLENPERSFEKKPDSVVFQNKTNEKKFSGIKKFATILLTEGRCYGKKLKRIFSRRKL